MELIKVHKKILEFIKAGAEVANFEYLKNELFVNSDAKAYFYVHIDHTWIVKLQKEGFFEVLNKKAPDTTTYAYRIPELAYLTNIREIAPKEVVDVIVATKTKENFNPEVIERFLWIAIKLPADQLVRVVEKMKNEQWVKLMARFRKTGYEFSEMVETLKKKPDWDGLINLAQAMMIVRSEKGDKYRDGLFYVSEISQSGIFEALAEIKDQEKIQELLNYLFGQYKTITETSGVRDSKGEYPFDYDDPFALPDEDLFTIQIERNKMRSFQADEKSFIALTVDLLKKISDGNIQSVWKTLNTLLTSRLTWKIQLIFLVSHKEHFTNELHDALNYLFGLDSYYYSIFSGSEYKKAIAEVFPTWSKEWQDDYISNLVTFFKKQVVDHPDQNWHARNAVQILSIISASVPDEGIKKIVGKHAVGDFGIPVNESYEPEPSIQSGGAGVVQHRSPFDISEFSIDEIFEHLKTDWDPVKLKEEYRNDDYLKPRGAEGLSDALKEHLKQNIKEYVSKMSADDYKGIHPHYVHSLVRGFDELFRDDTKTWTKSEVESILNVLINLEKQKSAMQEFKPVDDSWLGNWVWVKRSIADVLIYIIEFKNKDLRKEIHAEHRNEILKLLNFLFDTPESPNVEEEKPEYSDPFHIAINSVRGRAYQGFVIYVENDGEELLKDSKDFFEKALKDNSIAVRFVIGHYLPLLYYRDKKFIKGLFDQIFPKGQSDKLATWEGYLCSPLYKELYQELESYYLRAINIEHYQDRKFTKDLDGALASHVALAFVHFQENYSDGVIGKFLEKKNIKKIKEFITFIGRSYFTRDSADKSNLEKLPGGFEKFIKLWDWMLEQHLAPEAYDGFGFWINTKIIEPKLLVEKIDKTFEISGGIIGWDYQFEQTLEQFAQVDAKKTLNIIRNYLLDKNENLNPNRKYPLFSIENEIKSALEIVYKSESLQPEVEKLVNLLIEKGSQMFWELEEIIK